jgi:nucleoside 2-deoxyribosyltransferase
LKDAVAIIMIPKVYLAGPSVFELNRAEIFDRRKQLCAEMGFEGIAPIDSGPESNLPSTGLVDAILEAKQIRKNNIRKIRSCDAIIADITPFRGPGADDGTAWEMGFGEALGKIVLAYSEQVGISYATQVRIRIGARAFTELNDELVDANGFKVENFTLPANLMLASGSEEVLPSFEAALARLKARFRGD